MTVRSLLDSTPFPGAELRVLSAVGALGDPTMADPLFTGTAERSASLPAASWMCSELASVLFSIRAWSTWW